MQKNEPLDDDLAKDVESKRDWVRGHYSEESQDQYNTVSGKLRLLEAILENNWIEPEETLKLQCLGIIFGDALSQELGLDWVAVEDEYGRDPALSKPGTSILVFPQTSISKRIENSENVNVAELFEQACETIKGIERNGA